MSGYSRLEFRLVKVFEINQKSVQKSLVTLTQLLGAATWLLTFLAYFLSEIESARILSWLIAIFGIWLFAININTAFMSSLLQFIPLTLIMGTPIFFEEANLEPWIPITVLALNLIGIIGFTVDGKLALPGIFLTATSVKFLIIQNLDSFLYGGAKFASGWISVAYLVAVGITAWLVKIFTLRQARMFDSSMTNRLKDLEARRVDQATRELNSSVARKLHESVLNTLTGIDRIKDRSQLALLREVAKRDLDSLDEITQKLRPMPLGDLIQICILRSGIGNIEISVAPGCEVEVSIETLLGLQHSLTEALRNIDRHAHASKTYISWDCLPEKIILKIQDNGQGFDIDTVSNESYGLKVIRNPNLIEKGHRIEITSEIGIGTEVIWHLKDRANKSSETEEISEWPRLTQDNILFRFLFLVIPIFVGTLIYFLTKDFLNQQLVIVQYVIYLFLLSIYATLQPAKSRFVILFLLIVSIFSGQLNLIDQTSNCAEALPIQWIVNGYTVGILLTVLSGIPGLLKTGILIANVAVQSVVASSLGRCQEIVLLPGITGLVLSMGIIYGLKVLTKQNHNTINEYQIQLEKFVEQDMKQNVSDLAYLRMFTLTRDARSLLQRIIDIPEELDEVRSKAKVQESLLRSALQIFEATSNDVQEALLSLLSQLARQNVQVSISNWSNFLDQVIWPDQVVEFAYMLSNSLANGTCELTFIDQDNSVYLTVEGNGDFLLPIPKNLQITELTENRIRYEVSLSIARNTSQQIELPH